MSEDIELNKLRILLNAIESLDQKEDEPDFYGILKECAWNILHENPGTEFGDWVMMLIEQYPTEVVDAIDSMADEDKRILGLEKQLETAEKRIAEKDERIEELTGRIQELKKR
mgnify:CR=1 FL=1